MGAEGATGAGVPEWSSRSPASAQATACHLHKLQRETRFCNIPVLRVRVVLARERASCWPILGSEA
jgi:hypothetical protein